MRVVVVVDIVFVHPALLRRGVIRASFWTASGWKMEDAVGPTRQAFPVAAPVEGGERGLLGGDSSSTDAQRDGKRAFHVFLWTLTIIVTNTKCRLSSYLYVRHDFRDIQQSEVLNSE